MFYLLPLHCHLLHHKQKLVLFQILLHTVSFQPFHLVCRSSQGLWYFHPVFDNALNGPLYPRHCYTVCHGQTIQSKGIFVSLLKLKHYEDDDKKNKRYSRFFGNSSSFLPTASPITWVLTFMFSFDLKYFIISQIFSNSMGTPTILWLVCSW